jgi:Bacteriophage probable baseplate hub protein
MAIGTAYVVRSPEWILTYNGIDITSETSQMILGISYIDRLSAASGEVEIVVEDHQKRWQSSWYPSLGDQLSLQIGYRGEPLFNCGDFQLDQLELDGPPDTMRLRGLASYITPAMRTRNTAGYEDVTIAQIAQGMASKYGLQFIAAAQAEEDDIGFERVTQRLETDLEFLKRLAVEHGYDFAIRGSQLVFYTRSALKQMAATMTVSRSDVTSFSFKNKTRRVYGSAKVAYFNPDTKQLIAAGVSAPRLTPSADALKIVARCESGIQASSKAKAALELHNIEAVEMRIEGPGQVALVAGRNIKVEGWEALDGTYQIDSAHHRIDRASGYTTSIEGSRLG